MLFWVGKLPRKGSEHIQPPALGRRLSLHAEVANLAGRSRC